MPKGPADAAARVLAQRVLAGGDDALAALLTALQASGAAVRGPGDRLAVKPAEPWQGLIFESWEIRTMLATVLPERTVSFDLSDFAEVVRTPVPALKDAPVAQLLVQGLRTLAQGPPSPKRFWARFVVELGRGLEGPPRPVAEADVASIRLNGLQATLIARRLALDFLIRGGTDPEQQTVSNTSSRGWSFVEPVYADALPCTMNSTERTIMDIVATASKYAIGGLDVFGFGFDGVLKSMDKAGFEGAKQAKEARSYASTLLAYARFIATYAALEVNVSMDAAPLVRTKDMRPSSGERKDLTAAVRMNIGKAQMVNCFRIMLNAAGLDFKLPNDGAVKGAQVDWEGVTGFSESDAVLHNGPDQIVRFVGDPKGQFQGGGAFTSFNPIAKAVTGADGKARVTVEGVGQPNKLGQNVRRRPKQASVRVNVALKGADLVGDLKDAAMAAPGGVKTLTTLPLDILYRSRWASAGHYTFDVIDWSDEGKWTGTVTVSTTRTIDFSSQGAKGHGSSHDTHTMEAEMQVTDTIQDASSNGNIVGNMKASINAHYTWEGTDSGGQTGGGCDPSQELTYNRTRWAEGGAGGGEVIVVVVVTGTQVHLGVSSTSFQVPYSGSTDTDQQRARVGGGNISMKGSAPRTCTIETVSSSSAIKGSTGIGTIDVAGEADPKDPNHIHGTATVTFGDASQSMSQTVTWDLRRD